MPTNLGSKRFFSFSSFYPFLVIGLLKAIDDLSTMYLASLNVNNTGLQGENHTIPAYLYSIGASGYFLTWLLFMGLFAIGYFLLNNLKTPLPLPRKIKRALTIAYSSFVFVSLLIIVIGNLTY